MSLQVHFAIRCPDCGALAASWQPTPRHRAGCAWTFVDPGWWTKPTPSDTPEEPDA